MPNIRRLGLHNACKHRPRNVHAFGQHLSIRCKSKSELLDLCVEGCFFHRTQPGGRKKTKLLILTRGRASHRVLTPCRLRVEISSSFVTFFSVSQLISETRSHFAVKKQGENSFGLLPNRLFLLRSCISHFY